MSLPSIILLSFVVIVYVLGIYVYRQGIKEMDRERDEESRQHLAWLRSEAQKKKDGQ